MQTQQSDFYARLSVPGPAVTQHRRWASIDALRAIAALMVLASHAPWLGPSRHVGLAKLAPRLGVGVWIFFAASGYLIAGPFLRALLDGRALPSVRQYALRRAVRILPAYWIALAAILLLANGPAVAHWWQLPVHALLLHGLVPGELKNLYLVAWSLGVEAIFYALVPIAGWGVRRMVGDRPIRLDQLITGVIGLWCAAVACTVVVAIAFPIHAGRPLAGGVQVLDLVGSLANFCPGMLVFLALASRADGARAEAESSWRRCYRAVASRPFIAISAAALLFIAATELHVNQSHVAAAAQDPLLGLASGLVLAAFLHGEWTRRLARVLAPIGLISYGVYLWHWVILTALLHGGVTIRAGDGNLAIVARVALLVALTLPVALLSWLVVERPLLRRTADWQRGRSNRMPSRVRREEASAARSVPAPLPVSPRP